MIGIDHVIISLTVFWPTPVGVTNMFHNKGTLSNTGMGKMCKLFFCFVFLFLLFLLRAGFRNGVGLRACFVGRGAGG